MTDFRLTSSALEPGGDIPRRFTCDGENASPDVAWSGAPPDTQAFALVVDDPDARGFVHWAVLDFGGAESGALPAGSSASPDAPQQGTNDFGRIGWGGPCPPTGTHRYVFTLFALRTPLALGGAPRADDVRRAIGQADILATATLEGRYTRSR
jgi:Raf kinase inhibitor-like YbhB/YbcL family protein